jgi:hypothetical protein
MKKGEQVCARQGVARSQEERRALQEGKRATEERKGQRRGGWPSGWSRAAEAEKGLLVLGAAYAILDAIRCITRSTTAATSSFVGSYALRSPPPSAPRWGTAFRLFPPSRAPWPVHRRSSSRPNRRGAVSPVLDLSCASPGRGRQPQQQRRHFLTATL